MYSVYKIYQADKLVLVTYSDLIPEFTDTTKLKLIMNGPTIPISLFEDYFKTPELFSITTYKTGIYNALDASQIVQEESKLIGTDKPSIKPSKTKSATTRKPRTKKKAVSDNED
ncbi:hypothetical protein [Acinetobacter johnsonii]|uniref:hypothetical protein n=1 Tax=Acinetobacter johnsonii TaxID=40214 RepID=UPI00244A0A71|nr:hypothetical protein [Acinetobacter johnsonii]MDH1408485.1 hypothetical protein [Acinetobacter johnsonii]